MPWLLVGVLLCAGCDQVFGLVRGDAGTIDGSVGDGAPADALPPAHPCLGRAAPATFCYDFDEATLVGYERETQFPLAPFTMFANAEQRGPSATGPNGLWFTALGSGIGVITATDPAVTGHRIDATLAVRVASTGMNTTGSSQLVMLRLPQATVVCDADLSLRYSDQHLEYAVNCAGAAGIPADLGPVGPAWVPLALVFDVSAGLASVTLGAGPIEIAFPATGMNSTTPTVRFGIDPAMAGLSVGFDDVSIDVQ